MDQGRIGASPGIGDLSDFGNVASIIGILGVIAGVAALYFAYRQLRLSARATYNQLILMIDDAFYNFDDVRRGINQKFCFGTEMWVDEAKWLRYTAIFERLGIMLESRLITPEIVNVLYGERFERLVRVEPPLGLELQPAVAQQRLELRPQVAPQNWPGFIVLWKALAGVRDGVDLPEKLRK